MVNQFVVAILPLVVWRCRSRTLSRSAGGGTCDVVLRARTSHWRGTRHWRGVYGRHWRQLLPLRLSDWLPSHRTPRPHL